VIKTSTGFFQFSVAFSNKSRRITAVKVTGGFTPDQQVEHYIRNGIPDEIPKSEPSVVNHPTNRNQSVRHQPVSNPIRMTNIEPPATQQSKQEQALLVSSEHVRN